MVFLQYFEWTAERTSLVSSLTYSAVMRWSGEITSPLAFGFDTEALPDKTLDKLNSFQNLLPESQADHNLLWFQKDPRNVTARRHSFPLIDFEGQLFFKQFFFASRTTQGLLEHWFFIRIFSPSRGWIFLDYSVWVECIWCLDDVEVILYSVCRY